MSGNNMQMTRDRIIEKLSENKRDELEGAIDGQLEDYEADLGSMTDEQLAKEYQEAFDSQVEIVAHEVAGE
jgi:hypothetical protein